MAHKDIFMGGLERWWRGDPRTRHERVFSTVRLMNTRQRDRMSAMASHQAHYLGHRTFQPDQVAAQADHRGVRNRLTFNIVRSCIDTAANKISKNEPFPELAPSGGDWDVEQRCENLDEMLKGIFYECKTYQEARDVFHDCLLHGTGLMHVHTHPLTGRIKHERVHPYEVWVDRVEAMTDGVMQMHRRRLVDRDRLIAAYPDHRDDLIRAAESTHKDIDGYPVLFLNSRDFIYDHGNVVDVIESWRLPSGPDEDDGLHTICIPGACLLEEGWDRDRFPFARVIWSKAPGFWGTGLAETLAGIQVELDRVLQRIQLIMFDASVAKLFVEAGTKIVPSHVNNRVFSVIEYTGKTPTQADLARVPPDLWKAVETHMSMAYKVSGISEMDAQGEKPGSLTSGEALRAMSDITSERFVTNGQAYANLFMDIADLTIEEMRRAATGDDGDNYRVNVYGKSSLSHVDWSDVDMERDQFKMRMHLMSSLPDTMSGKLDKVVEMQKAQYIDRETAMQLLNMPDIQAFTDLETAPRESVMQDIADIMRRGKMRVPEDFQPLSMCVDLGKKAYLDYRRKGAPEGRLDMLRTYVGIAASKLAQAQQAQMMQQQMGAQAPPGPNETGAGVAPQPPPGEMPGPSGGDQGGPGGSTPPAQ